jgi:alpha-mannosidase
MSRLIKRHGATSSAQRTRTPPGMLPNSKYVDTRYASLDSSWTQSVTWAPITECVKLADLSDSGYGVAILSESKYGYSCQANVLRISLLRAATAPDGEQDQGACGRQFRTRWSLRHNKRTEMMQASMTSRGLFIPTRVTSFSRMSLSRLIYSTPHCTVRLRSSFPQFDSLETDEDYAMKVRCVPSGGASSSIVPRMPPFLVHARHNNVFLETFKRGDLDDVKGVRTIVIRLYEAYGGHASIGLQINMP